MNKAKSVLLLLLSLTVGVSGQLKIIKQLSLEEALEINKKNNLTLLQQNVSLLQLVREYEIQKSENFPSFSLNGGFIYVSDLARLELPFSLPGLNVPTIEAGVKKQYDVNAAVRQSVFTGFRTRNLIKSAFENIQESKYQQLVLTNTLQLQIYQMYYTSCLFQLKLKVLDKSSSRIKHHLLSVKHFFDAGQVTRYDTMKVANQLLEIVTEKAKTEHVLKIALSQLALFLNVSEIENIEEIETENVVCIVPPIEDLLRKAYQNRPEFAALQHKKQSINYQKSALEGGLFPQIFAQASYHYSRPGVNFFKDEWMDYYRIDVGFQWEIWHHGQTRNKIEKVKHSLELLELSEQELTEKIRHEINQIFQTLISEKEQILLATRLVKQEQERYRIVNEKFEQNLATTIDLTDAETDLTSAELQLKQAYINWLIYKARMDHATGDILLGEI
jgi:outer membrane protein